MESKKCIKCGEMKPLTRFHKNNTRQDGLVATCSDCKSIQHKLRVAKNPEAYYEKKT